MHVLCKYRIEKMAKLEVSGQNPPPIVTAVGMSSLLNLDPSRFFIYLGMKHYVLDIRVRLSIQVHVYMLVCTGPATTEVDYDYKY